MAAKTNTIGGLRGKITERIKHLRKEKADLENIKEPPMESLPSVPPIENLPEKPSPKVSRIKAPEEKKIPLGKPFHEVKIQVENLEEEKADLEKVLRQIKDDLAVNQDNEYDTIKNLSKKAEELMNSTDSLRKRIKNGVDLNKKRFEIEKELADVVKKIERLSKIRAELAEVWE